MKKLRSGQGTLEYVIILAAVVGAIIIIAGYVKSNLNRGYTDLGGKMESKVKGVTFN